MNSPDSPPVLLLNTGSSTIKWSLLSDDERLIASGAADWRASDPSARRAQIADIVAKLPPCRAVGHRIVHGGTLFRESTVVKGEVRRCLEQLVPLDPLHMIPALCTLDAARDAYPHAPQIAAFDTAFHATLSEAARTYAIPQDWSRKWGIQRFGFHGLSLSWVVGWLRQHLNPFPSKLIVAHLGSGCSVSALLEGRSIDTSMGFTPLEGLVMGTRSGSVDPGVLLFLQRQGGIAAAELEDALTARSGLLGISGIASDIREVICAADAGNAQARLAYEMFVLYGRRAVGAAAGVLGGTDAIVFTGGIGEHQPSLRRDICEALPGVAIDDRANGGLPEGIISSPQSRVMALVIRAREDLVMLREVQALAAKPTVGLHTAI